MAAIEAAFDKFKDEDGEISLQTLAEVSHISAHSVMSLGEQTALCCPPLWLVVGGCLDSMSSRCDIPGAQGPWYRSVRSGGRENVQRC